MFFLFGSLEPELEPFEEEKKQKRAGAGWEKEMRNQEPEVRGWRAGAALRRTKEPEALEKKKKS